MKQFFIIGFLSLFFISCNSSEVTNSSIEKNDSVNIQQDLQTYNIGFYNVENLFDTIDDPKTEDEWFLPTSETEWNSEKYIKKLADLSKVIDAMNSENGGPDIIGLCEVENYQVVKDLASEPVLKDNHYDVIHFDSPDARGIDVAALYNTTKFKLLDSQPILLSIADDENYRTRDILYCKFEVIDSKNILHVYVNHWSSRRGGAEESSYKRENAAKTLKNHIVENIPQWETQNIIILGDMNDYPTNNSIYAVLEAQELDSESHLVNLQLDNHIKGLGTYNYKGEWGCLDNIIVTKGLKTKLKTPGAVILKEDWMMYIDKEGNATPNRTYGGPNYYGGISDHLPVYFEVEL
jgi:predicted extracellular nuclease